MYNYNKIKKIIDETELTEEEFNMEISNNELIFTGKYKVEILKFLQLIFKINEYKKCHPETISFTPSLEWEAVKFIEDILGDPNIGLPGKEWQYAFKHNLYNKYLDLDEKEIIEEIIINVYGESIKLYLRIRK